MENAASDTELREGNPELGFRAHEVFEYRLQTLVRRRKKKARTKEILIAATARELDRVGYELLTIDGIVSAAGVVRATFYGYFRSLSHAVITVIRRYYALVHLKRPRRWVNRPIREAIHNSNQYFVNLALLNARLLEAREALSIEEPTLNRMLLRINSNWAQKFVRYLGRIGVLDPGSADVDASRLKAIAMIKMSNGLLREVISRETHISSDFHYPSELVVQVMDDIWIRAFHVD